MDREDVEKLDEDNKNLKEFERWREHDLPTEIAEGRHICLFYFGRCVCGKREEESMT